MKLARKYSRAVNSSNLRDDDQHHQTDVLAAMALGSVENHLGPLLYRVKFANQASSYPQLMEKWGRLMLNRSIICVWPEHIKPEKISSLSLDYWLNDACQTCTGRKSDRIDNTPCLSGVDCADCGGTGRRALECDPREIPYVENAVVQLDIIIRRSGNAGERKLSAV